jgi:hypothetical protein
MTIKNIFAEIWSFIKLNFKWIAVAVLALILYSKGCFDRFGPQKPTVVITRDTTIIQHVGGGYSKPNIIVNIPPTSVEVPPADTSYAKLAEQYNQLGSAHYAKNISKDRLTIDTLGWVDVTDTVSRNVITGRGYNFNIKERLIKENTTITNPPKNQVFIGVGVQSDLNKPNINQVGVGVLFKNKKDNILGIGATYTVPTKKTGLSVSYYRKISLKKPKLIP